MLRGEIVAGESGALQRFTKAFGIFLADWRDRASKEQTEIDFTNAVTISAVKLRADKPKLKQKEYSIGIDMSNVSMDDRSKLYNMSQDKAKVLHISITSQPRISVLPDGKPIKQAGKSDKVANKTNGHDEAVSIGSSRAGVIDHSMGELSLPAFAADSLEERLQLALLIREGAAMRWVERIKKGQMTDRDLKRAITSEWAGSLYEAPDDGAHFIVQGGNKPRFRMATLPGLKANITSKPNLQGAQLLSKVREVFVLTAPARKHTI
jgi:hypothetical protein